VTPSGTDLALTDTIMAINTERQTEAGKDDQRVECQAL
jgi:hypothetical protein